MFSHSHTNEVTGNPGVDARESKRAKEATLALHHSYHDISIVSWVVQQRLTRRATYIMISARKEGMERIPTEDPCSEETVKEDGIDDHLTCREPTSASEQDRTSLLTRSDKDDDAKSSTSETDVISSKVIKGSRGPALVAIITVMLCMVTCSFLLLYEFDVNEATKFVSAVDTTTPQPLRMPKYDANEFCQAPDSSQMPLGQRILEFQIHVIQNLVHASLVGSAAMVAAVRGDALWMFYVRNVAFFFMPIGYLHAFLDLRSVWMGETSLQDHNLRLSLALLSALAATVAYVIYTPVFFKIRRLLNERARRGFVDDENQLSGFPHYLAETKVEANLASVIYVCANLVQLLAYAYYADTFTAWLSQQSSCPSEMGQPEDRGPNHTLTNLEAFEMAYSSGSHQALLHALFFLAATYPRDIASVGGALLTSSWRLLVGIGSLLHLWMFPNANTPLSSWVNTTIEVAVMLPIVIASFSLAMRILRNSKSRMNNQSLADEEASGNHDCVPNRSDDVEIYQCPSLFQIAQSEQYSAEQRKGARLMGCGTLLLLIELSVECIIVLRQNRIGTDMTHEIYKWGMHICVMYIFCSHMCVETPFIFHKARKLLMAACPSGSIVALCQVSTLFCYSRTIHEDLFGQLVAALLSIRAIAGVIQLVGLQKLKDLEPLAAGRSNATSFAIATNTLPLSPTRVRLVQLHRALLEVYVPVLAVYIFVFALLGNCYAPLVSSSLTREPCTQRSSTDLLLAENWPGMGLFFHYGMIIVIFTVNGGRKSIPSYKPSLPIASLFSIHVSVLILADLCWDAVQTDYSWSSLSASDMARRLMALLWMLASALLWFCIERLSQARHVPL